MQSTEYKDNREEEQGALYSLRNSKITERKNKVPRAVYGIQR